MAISAKKIWIQNHFYAKMNTILLLCLYQIFIFLLGHLHFFLRFFLTFMENLFKKHPIFWIKPSWGERVLSIKIKHSLFSFFCQVIFVFSCIFSSRLWRTFKRNTLYYSGSVFVFNTFIPTQVWTPLQAPLLLQTSTDERLPDSHNITLSILTIAFFPAGNFNFVNCGKYVPEKFE